MLLIKQAPVGNFEPVTKENHSKYKTVAMGKTHKQVLNSLIAAVNADEVDEDSYLIMIEDESADKLAEM